MLKERELDTPQARKTPKGDTSNEKQQEQNESNQTQEVSTRRAKTTNLPPNMAEVDIRLISQVTLGIEIALYSQIARVLVIQVHCCAQILWQMIPCHAMIGSAR